MTVVLLVMMGRVLVWVRAWWPLSGCHVGASRDVGGDILVVWVMRPVVLCNQNSPGDKDAKMLANRIQSIITITSI